MGSFPGSPRTVSGALVAIDPASPLSRIVVFQYNPDLVTRTIKPRSADTKGQASGGQASAGAVETHRLIGAPVETITMTVELDATDGLETAQPIATATGVATELAALEMLLYPNSTTIIANTTQLLAGTIEILPAQGPMTVLVWGPLRAVPVRIDSLVIREQAFTPTLLPLRAAVDLDLTVLSYSDVMPTDPAYALFLVHQVAKEALATTAGAMAVAAVATGSGA